VAVDVPLPWERLLWSARALWPARARFALTDFRLVRTDRAGTIQELLLDDVTDVEVTRSASDRVLRTATIVVSARGASIKMERVRHGSQLAALLVLLTNEPRPSLDAESVQRALSWRAVPRRTGPARLAAALVAGTAAVFGIAIGLRGESPAIVYGADDAIAPGGVKRDREEIVRFMEREVLPWARVALAPVVGSADLVECSTCHGEAPDQRDWQMPSVAALPEPHLRAAGWETYSAGMDPQLRNAIYGYLAESDKQARAGYMREIVMPGMAKLLRRPAYDFTKTYDFNRARGAFGCYHCHRVNVGGT
jgi:hypothetical protein